VGWIFSRVSAERVLVVSDACYAGLLGNEAQVNRAVGGSVLQEFRNSSGRAIISSSTGEQISWEAPQLKTASSRTIFLRDKRKADKDMTRSNPQRAYEYAYSRTKDQTEGRQHPQIEGKTGGAFPLSFVGLRLPPSELRKKVLEAAASGNLAHLEQFLASGAMSTCETRRTTQPDRGFPQRTR